MTPVATATRRKSFAARPRAITVGRAPKGLEIPVVDVVARAAIAIAARPVAMAVVWARTTVVAGCRAIVAVVAAIAMVVAAMIAMVSAMMVVAMAAAIMATAIVIVILRRRHSGTHGKQQGDGDKQALDGLHGLPPGSRHERLATGSAIVE